MANDLKEVWIADQPFLLMAYLWQYMPTLAWWLTNKVGKKRITNFKSGMVRAIYIFLFSFNLIYFYYIVLVCDIYKIAYSVSKIHPLHHSPLSPNPILRIGSTGLVVPLSYMST
jgi:hypothetical protein